MARTLYFHSPSAHDNTDTTHDIFHADPCNKSYLLHTFPAHCPIMCSMRYQPISHTLYFTLHCAHVLNNVVLNTIIEMIKILNGRVGKHSVNKVCNKQFITLSHCEVISLAVCICTRLRLVKILTLLVK